MKILKRRQNAHPFYLMQKMVIEALFPKMETPASVVEYLKKQKFVNSVFSGVESVDGSIGTYRTCIYMRINCLDFEEGDREKLNKYIADHKFVDWKMEWISYDPHLGAFARY